MHRIDIRAVEPEPHVFGPLEPEAWQKTRKNRSQSRSPKTRAEPPKILLLLYHILEDKNYVLYLSIYTSINQSKKTTFS